MQHKERHENDQPVQHAFIPLRNSIQIYHTLFIRHACNQTPKSILTKKLSAKDIPSLPHMPCIA